MYEERLKTADSAMKREVHMPVQLYIARKGKPTALPSDSDNDVNDDNNDSSDIDDALHGMAMNMTIYLLTE